MKLIVAVDKNWGIGKNNGLLFDLKADMRHFVEHTRHKTVLMGYNTLRSLPGGMPLKGRVNIVLYPEGRDEDASQKGYILVRTIAEVANEVKKYAPEDVYVIGGAMMYHTMLPYCEEAVITKVDADGGATVFLDNLDALDNWKLESAEPPIDDGGYNITFCTYKNDNVLPL